MTDNILMVSADRSVVAGEKGPFYYTLEAFARHWDRIDVIGTRPERVAQTTGGHFIRNPRGAAALASLMSGGSGRRTGRQKLVRIPIDRFQWPLALGIAALLIGSISNRGAE